MGGVCFEGMKKRNHDLFVWITPRYNLITPGKAPLPIGLRRDAEKLSLFGRKAILFEPVIKHNGTEEQKTYWLAFAMSDKIFGTYAQTELGHGSFVRGLETTATFNQTKDEFVVHSSTISSAKFWPVALGFSTTHSVLMAQLVVDQKQLGPYLFSLCNYGHSKTANLFPASRWVTSVSRWGKLKASHYMRRTD
jgi:acyl-CoA oxidase